MKLPRLTTATARAAMLAVFFILTLIIISVMIFMPEMANNDLFKTIAQAIIVQGLVGLIAAFYFTASNEGDGP